MCGRPGAAMPVFLVATERHIERVQAELATIDWAGGCATSSR
jgi:hypothetical protein